MRLIKNICLGMVPIVLFVTSSLAQVTWETVNFADPGYFTNNEKNCVVDMNGDYKDDIVGVSYGKISIYYQEDDGNFTTKTIRLEDPTIDLWSICASDIDENGYNDLALGYEDNVTFLYADATAESYRFDSKDEYVFSQRTTFVDIDNDGFLDIFVCHDEDENLPFRNDGTGNLVLDYDMLKTPEDLEGNYTSTFVDYDNDGDLDLHLAKCVIWADAGYPGRTNLLYNNDGQGNYTEVGANTNIADNDQTWTALWEDFDHDMDFDLIVFNHEIQSHYMLNNGDGTFTDITEDTGFDAFELQTYEAVAADFDNDGNLDFATDDPSGIYYGNGDNTFEFDELEIEIGALGDLNDDGFVDIVYNNNVYYNEGNDNHWIKVNLIGQASNRSGIGAKIEVYGAWGVQVRELKSSHSWSLMNSLTVGFGIGENTTIDRIEVKWPSGTVSVIENPIIDQTIFIDESGCNVEIPSIDVDGDRYICEGEERTLTAPEGYQAYAWSDGSTSRSITISKGGNYNVTVTDENGCSSLSKAEAFFYATELPEIIAPDGVEICSGTPLLLEVDTDADVEWSTGDKSKTIFAAEAGIYSVSLSKNCGTTVTQQIEIVELDIANPQSEEFIIDPTVSINLLTVDDDRVLFWYKNANDAIPFFVGNPLYLSNVTQDSVLHVSAIEPLSNGGQCFSEKSPMYIKVEQESSNQITVQGDLQFCEGGNVILAAPAGYSYNWSNGESNAIVIATDSGSYSVTITDNSGNEEVLPAVIVLSIDPEKPDTEDIVVDGSEPTIEIDLGLDGLKWYDAPVGGNLLYEGSAVEHIVDGDFTYYVENCISLSNEEECCSDRVPLNIRFTSSVDNIKEASQLSVYPNPTESEITVVSRQGHTIEEIKVTSLKGEILKKLKPENPTSSKIQMGEYNNGIYIIKSLINGKWHTEKVLVVK